jgi:hypothetical protein
MLTVVAVSAIPLGTLEADLSDGKTLTLDVAKIIGSTGYKSLTDPEQFAVVTVSEWDYGIEWSAMDQALSIETLLSLAREQSSTASPTADFNTWMKRNGLSLTTAAQALGLSRRTIIDCSTGQKPIPIHIVLACEGWEVCHHRQMAECTHSQGRIGNRVGEASLYVLPMGSGASGTGFPNGALRIRTNRSVAPRSR